MDGHQWAYLAIVLDDQTNQIVSYNLETKTTSQLTNKPVIKAHWALPNALIIHSDMGSQYTSRLFDSTSDSYGSVHSYSLLKLEWVLHQNFISIAHARLSIIKHIE
ncbi:DDE-type integrase/transposase/recombinase [Lactobacillaceae bacterium Melli_B4]